MNSLKLLLPGIGLLFMGTIAPASFAADLQEQPSCHIPYELAGWTVSSPAAYSAVSKKTFLGQTIPAGDVLFYISLKDAKRVYSATESIELKDKSPLNPNTKIEAGETLPTIFTMSNGETSYDVILTGSGLFGKKMFPVKPDGYLCKNQIDTNTSKRLTTVGMPVVLQGAPLKSSTIDVQGAPVRSVAIALQRVNGAVAEVEATLMVNGKKAKSVTREFDSFTGTIDLGGLGLSVKKEGNGLKLLSISEPGNYYTWIEDYFQVRL